MLLLLSFASPIPFVRFLSAVHCTGVWGDADDAAADIGTWGGGGSPERPRSPVAVLGGVDMLRGVPKEAVLVRAAEEKRKTEQMRKQVSCQSSVVQHTVAKGCGRGVPSFCVLHPSPWRHSCTSTLPYVHGITERNSISIFIHSPSSCCCCCFKTCHFDETSLTSCASLSRDRIHT